MVPDASRAPDGGSDVNAAAMPVQSSSKSVVNHVKDRLHLMMHWKGYQLRWLSNSRLATQNVKATRFTADSRVYAQDRFKQSKLLSLSMIMFSLSYAPVHPGVWSVDAGNNDCPEFKSRLDALRFAVGAAVRSEQGGHTALIAIEGVDGQWRLFDHQTKGMA